jgi:hypothetical protein
VSINDPIRVNECVEDASKILARLLGQPGTTRIDVTGDVEFDVQAVIMRKSEQSLSLSIGKEAVVDVTVHDFEGPAFEEEAGTWLVAEVSLRTDLSFALSLSFAIAVALRTCSTVLDDAGHLRLGRHLAPDDLIVRLQLPVSSISLEEAAGRLCRSLGFRFGSD